MLNTLSGSKQATASPRAQPAASEHQRTSEKVRVWLGAVQHAKQRKSRTPRDAESIPLGYGLVEWYVDRSIDEACIGAICTYHMCAADFAHA